LGIKSLVTLFICQSILFLGYGQSNEDLERINAYYEKAQFDSVISFIDHLDKRKFYDGADVKLQNVIGNAYLRSFKFEEAKSAYHKSLRINNNSDFSYQKAKSLLGLADVYSWEHKHDSIKIIAEKLTKIITSKDHPLYGHYLLTLGTSNFPSGYEAVKKYYRRAIKYFPKNNDQIIRLYIWLADIFIEENILDSGLHYTRQAIKLAKEDYPEDKNLLANCYNELGFYYHTRGAYNEAVKTYLDSSLFYLKNSKVDVKFLRSETYRLLGRSYQVLGNYERCIHYKQLNYELKKEILSTDHYRLGEAYLWLSTIYYKIGMIDKAAAFINQAIPIFTKVSAIGYLAQSQIYLGSIAFDNKDYSRAAYHYDSALALTRSQTSLYYTKATANFNKAILYKKQGKYDSALLAITNNDLIISDHNDKNWLIADQYFIKALVYQEVGEIALAERAFKRCISILSSWEKKGNQYLIIVLNYYSKFLLENNELNNVQSYIKEAVLNNILADNFVIGNYPQVDNVTNGFQYLTSFHLISKFYFNKYLQGNSIKNLHEAFKSCMYTQKLFGETKKNFLFNTKDQFFLNDLHSKLFLHSTNVLQELYEVTGEYSYLEKLYETTEKSNSAVLLHEISERAAFTFTSIPDTLLIREASFKKQLIYLQTKVLNTENEVRLEAFKKELFNAKVAYEELIKKFESNYPNYYDLKYNTQTYSIKDTQIELMEGQALIKYINLKESTLVFCITKDTVRLHTLPVVSGALIETFRSTLNPNFIDSKATTLYNDFTDQSFDLYTKLLSPVLTELPGEINSLIIIPDGLLSVIPFEALITDKSKGSAGNYQHLPYLIKKYNVSYGYSATSLFKLKELATPDDQKFSILSFAPSEFEASNNNLSRLKWSQNEVESLSDIFNNQAYTGSLATEKQLKASFNKYPVTHLATHAIINHQDPMYSKLVFAPSNDTIEDGMLHTFELYNMDINTNMMVLSACNTGFGKLQKGEGVMSLARAFAYAGCPSVVMSHWAVDDKSTSQLMQFFYSNLKKGLSKDKALRQAKLSFLENSSPLYHHPYYWNNFVVMGDTKPIAQNSTMVYWYILVALILTVATALSYKKLFN